MAFHIIPACAFASICLGLATLSYFHLQQPRNLLWYTQAAAIIFFEWFFSNLVYKLAFHPLAKYPGPLIASLTDWYTVYWIAEGGRHLELDKQHKKYGKFVRFGPNRLSINSARASRDLHDVNSNTFKADAYGSFKRFFGAEMSLTTVDHKAHAFRRRVNMTAITPAAVKEFEDQVTPHLDEFISIIGEGAGSKSQGEHGWSPGKDMSYAVAFCIADIMGSVTFGRTWNVQRDPKYRHFVKDLPNGVAGIHLVGHMQSLFFCNLHKVLFKELIVGVGNLMSVSRSFALWRLEQSSMPYRDIWQALLASRDPKTGNTFSTEELISEASLFIIGGTDGMITATTSTLFYLTHNPRTLKRLTREIREAFPLSPEDVGKKGSNRIAYLPACIDEAMRMSPPVPSILPRVVGPGGLTVDGEYFPAGVNLGIPHYSMHHSEDNFAEPLTYAPERWLPEERKESSKMRPAVGQSYGFTPFGGGRSSCIGKYLAYQEMSIALARLIWLLDIRLDPSSNMGEGIGDAQEGRGCKTEFQLYDRFVSSQKGPMLQFRYREELAA
ncbi:cytochrome p450 domain-containing protein [Trichoderma breve]|uniref:Cytochrome p450 domain-containing protein n=1 Tax=Trichoderma breve TaxID=2034170 RepID=A0A9W9B6P5_9HYPO|nr:cytochrome p450 domain-containing protein [Trichoderma breve]KAJ4856997.1 cytochrome p450 domain-containing protein [Trichoderma breve]